MINQKDNPVAWALLTDELQDAHEHLGNLIRAMEGYEDPETDEEDFRINLGHVYEHLNRAWHKRSDPDGQYYPEKWQAQSQWPASLAIGVNEP